MTEENDLIDSSDDAETTEEVVTTSEPAADEAVDEAVNNEEDDDEHKAHKKSWAERRIGELTREKYEYRREAEAAKQEAQRLREQYGKADNGVPDAVDIDTLVEQAAEKKLKAREFDEKCTQVYERGKKEFQDFDKALADIGMLDINEAFLDTVVSSDNADKVLYYLSQNMDEAERISRLPAARMGMAIAKLDSKIANEPKQPKAVKQVSKAPAPIRPVSSTETATDNIGDLNDFENYLKWRKKK